MTGGTFLGVSPLILLVMRFGMPWLVKWGLSSVNGLLKSPYRTDADDVAEELGKRTNDDYENRSTA